MLTEGDGPPWLVALGAAIGAALTVAAAWFRLIGVPARQGEATIITSEVMRELASAIKRQAEASERAARALEGIENLQTARDKAELAERAAADMEALKREVEALKRGQGNAGSKPRA